MKHLKLFEDFYYEETLDKEESHRGMDKSCPGCGCENCECSTDEVDEFDDESEFELDGDEFGDRRTRDISFIDPEGEEDFDEDDSDDFEDDFEDENVFVGESKKGKKPAFLFKGKGKKDDDKKDAKDEKESKSDKKGDKKLTAAQKKLPQGLRDAIARKAAKKNPKD